MALCVVSSIESCASRQLSGLYSGTRRHDDRIASGSIIPAPLSGRGECVFRIQRTQVSRLMIKPFCTCRQQSWNRSDIWELCHNFQAFRIGNLGIVSRLRRLFSLVIKVLVFFPALLSLDSNINAWNPEILCVIADRILVISDCLVGEFSCVARILIMSGLSSIETRP